MGGTTIISVLHTDQRKPDRHSAVGSLCSQSLNQGDGHWCEVCRKKGKYSWIESYFEKQRCPGISKGWHKKA